MKQILAGYIGKGNGTAVIEPICEDLLIAAENISA
jgi:hypothetical protein